VVLKNNVIISISIKVPKNNFNIFEELKNYRLINKIFGGDYGTFASTKKADKRYNQKIKGKYERFVVNLIYCRKNTSIFVAL